MAAVAGKPFFVFHEAFDYFEAAYGLRHAGVFSVAAEVQPGARHVAAMRARLQQAGPSCMFNEPPVRPRLAETLTAGLPVHLAELDALGMQAPLDAGATKRCWRAWATAWRAAWKSSEGSDGTPGAGAFRRLRCHRGFCGGDTRC